MQLAMLAMFIPCDLFCPRHGQCQQKGGASRHRPREKSNVSSGLLPLLNDMHGFVAADRLEVDEQEQVDDRHGRGDERIGL